MRHRYQSAGEALKALEMEPYLESLAKNMATQPSGNQKRLGNIQSGTAANPTNPPSGGKSFAEVAVAIQARRAAETLNVQAGGIMQTIRWQLKQLRQQH